MLRHIVMFKMKDSDDSDLMLNKLKTEIDRLSDLDMVEFLETGLNISPRPTAFDLVLVSDFKDEDALEAYRVHPQHQEVIALVKEVTQQVHVVDFNK